jgi:hypothetical protein
MASFRLLASSFSWYHLLSMIMQAVDAGRGGFTGVLDLQKIVESAGAEEAGISMEDRSAGAGMDEWNARKA